MSEILKFTINEETQEAKIKLKGNLVSFDSAEITKILNGNIRLKKIIFDLSQVKFIDSRSIGFFLDYLEKARKKNIDILLSKPQGQVLKMLEISNFDHIFDIEK